MDKAFSSISCQEQSKDSRALSVHSDLEILASFRAIDDG